ncbi:MAG: HigA family addiction module antidote protein [Paludibacteraceae bacterium]|nr:HigA family addiction module antidote protein [Paludibacteraceae bacterium]
MAALGYPFYPVHPGEVIKDELEARNISQREFARQVDMSYTVLNELVNGKRSLTPSTALMFETALDIPADALMAIQTKYNMQTARQDSKLQSWLSRIPRVAAML